MDRTASSALLPPTLRVTCAQSQSHWPSLWGPAISCVWDTANTLFGNVGTSRRLVPADAEPSPVSDQFKCGIFAKHLFEFNVEYQCRSLGDASDTTTTTRCVHNTTVWLGSVLSPVAEFELRLPNMRTFVDLSYMHCASVRQVLNCPGLSLNGSFFETAADVSLLQPIRCFLSYAVNAAVAEVQRSDELMTMASAPLQRKLFTDPTALATTETVRLAFGSHRPADVEDVMRLMDGSYDWWFLCVLLFVVAGAVGNVLVCLAVVLDRRLHNMTNYFLFSLAIADLLVSLVVMPLGAIPSFIGYWPLSLPWCNIYVTCDVLACSSSILHMCFISVGRYTGINNPLGTRHSSTKRRTFVKITLVWLMAMMVCSSITILALLDEQNIMPHAHTCTINNRAFFVFGSLVTFYIPMVVMVSSYAATVRLLGQKAKFVYTHPESEQWRRTTTIKSGSANPLVLANGRGGGSGAGVSDVNRLPLNPANDDQRGRTTSNATARDNSKQSNSHHQSPDGNAAAVTVTVDDGDDDYVRNATDRAALQSIRRSTGSTHRRTQAQVVKTTDQATQTPRQIPQALDDNGNGCDDGIANDAAGKRYTLRSLNLQFGNVARPAVNLNIRFLNSRRNKRGNLSANAVATERKASKVLGIVFFTFVLCWSPFFVLNIVFAICPECPIPDHVVSVCLWLGYVSSTINPIIYTIFNRTFRAAFIRLLRCDCKKYSSTPRYRSVTDSRYSASQWGGPASSSGGVESGTKGVQTGAAYSPAQRSSGVAGYGQLEIGVADATASTATAPTQIQTKSDETSGPVYDGSPPQQRRHYTTPLLAADTAADVRRAVTAERPSQQNNQPNHHSQCSRRLAEFGGSYAITDDEC